MEHNVNDNPHDHLKIINVISLAPVNLPQGAIVVQAPVNPPQAAVAVQAPVNHPQGVGAVHAPVNPPQGARRVRRRLSHRVPSRHFMILRNNRSSYCNLRKLPLAKI